MTNARWLESAANALVQVVIIEGELILLTPAHLGGGESDGTVDMPLLTDLSDGKTALLSGATIAGALRSYLRTREQGYRQPLPSDAGEERDSAAVALFGGQRGDRLGEQSPLIVEDALGNAPVMELRQGVRINPASRTADDGALFDLETWSAGLRFPLRFELQISERHSEQAGQLKQALATALQGFSDGGIALGARKRRGFGRVRVGGWQARVYDLAEVRDLVAWRHAGASALREVPVHHDLAAALGVSLLPDRRRTLLVEATFRLGKGQSLLVRSGSGPEDSAAPDTVQLHLRQVDGSLVPVLPGASLAGALRARCTRIARTIAAEMVRQGRLGEDRAEQRVLQLVDHLFGLHAPDQRQSAASRVAVDDAPLTVGAGEELANYLAQFRVSIDRFTGGARDTALFNEQPAFGGPTTALTVRLRVETPLPQEIGLLLLALKDLWLDDLAVGGASGVGRGRLRGDHAVIALEENGAGAEWRISTGDDGRLAVSGSGSLETLQGAVDELWGSLTSEDS